MSFEMKRKTLSGTEEFRLPTEEIGPLETACIECFDERIADLICLFLSGEIFSGGIESPEELFEHEREHNMSDGTVMNGYSATFDNGVQLSTATIKQIFYYIWDERWMIWEEAGADYNFIEFYNKLARTEDPEELLFWSFRFCAWSENVNRLPYTLFRYIVDGKFMRFYDSYPEWQKTFLCLGEAGE